MQKMAQSIDNLLRIIDELQQDNERLKGVTSLKGQAITQHYWPEPECEGQAEYLKQYIEAQKRERRLQVLPKTEAQEQAEIEELVRRMALVGIPCAVMAAGGILFLLITHFG